MISQAYQLDINRRIADADKRYGPFASTHEALGVASEEWDEFRAAVHSNDLLCIEKESLDLAAVLLRLIEQLSNDSLKARSVK